MAGFPAQGKDGEEVGEASQLSLIHVLLPDFISNPPAAGKGSGKTRVPGVGPGTFQPRVNVVGFQSRQLEL